MSLYETHPVEHAAVHRREPDYSTGGDYPFPGHPDAHTPGPVEELGYLPQTGRRVPVAIEARELVTIEYGEQAAQATLDGTGAGTVSFGPVPAGQWWLLDAITARGGAAGNVLAWLDSATSDMNLVYANVLAGPAFAATGGPPSYLVKPGRVLVVGFVGAGAAAIATAKIIYRIGVYRPGEQVSR